MKRIMALLVVILFDFVWCGVGSAQTQTLDALLDDVKHSRILDSKENARREAVFKNQHEQRKRLLKETNEALEQATKRSEMLKNKLNSNDAELAKLEQRVVQNSATLDELFGVVRQISGEVNAMLKHSLVSAEIPGRETFLKSLANSKSLPALKDLNQLWFEMQREMTVAGKVARFSKTIITAKGQEEERLITRVGTFNVISDGAYLQYYPDSGQLIESARQPPKNFGEMAQNLENATAGAHPFALDPSRGSLLSLLMQVPGVIERVHQGGIIGYVILGIGAIALLISVERYLYFLFVGFKIRLQRRREKASVKNPLGRIVGVYTSNKEQDVGTLTLKLDEAILKEIPRLEKRLVLLGIFATIAPLLGLLGTVVGMIETFQSIALFGTGDPKLMSGGISQALVTTGLGLIVAVPIILAHGVLHTKSNRLIQILDEESAGLVAERAELRSQTQIVNDGQV